MTWNFGEFLRRKGLETAQHKPAPRVSHSHIVYLRRREDGSVEEKDGAPPFMYGDRKSVVGKIILPTDHFWRGSPEHIARLAEMESETGA